MTHKDTDFNQAEYREEGNAELKSKIYYKINAECICATIYSAVLITCTTNRFITFKIILLVSKFTCSSPSWDLKICLGTPGNILLMLENVDFA